MKNKVAPPFKSAEFDIMFGLGISKMSELLDMGVNADIIGKSGSWFSFKDTKLAQGRDATLALLRDNPEMAEEIETEVREWLKQNDPSAKSSKGKKAAVKSKKTIKDNEEIEDEDLEIEDFDDDDSYEEDNE